MKKLILIGLVGLLGSGMTEATPQTSDADLKAAQRPALTAFYNGSSGATSIDCHGSAVVLPSSVSFLDIYDASQVDATAITGVGPAYGQSFFWFCINGSPLKNGDVSGLLAAMSGFFPGVPSALYLFDCGVTGTLALTMAGGTWDVEAPDNNLTGVDISGCSITLGDAGGGYGIGLNVFDNPSLSTLVVGDGIATGITAWSAQSVSFAGCALTNTSENNFLAMCVATETNIPGQYGSLDISGGTNAAPDDMGAGYISTLVATGWTITTN